MKTEQKETKLISEGELSLLIDDEFSNTMLVHKQLLHQCGKLADAMGCTSPYIIKIIIIILVLVLSTSNHAPAQR